jgi:hypothetical protein
MKVKVIVALVGVVAALLAGAFAYWLASSTGGTAPPQPPPLAAARPAEPAPPLAPIEGAAPRAPKAPSAGRSPPPQVLAEASPAPVNKAERLAQLRETFRALAAGDPRTALSAAKQLADGTERETALLALVTEWTRGELGPPQQRAWAIATFGLETGLGLELAQNPQMAVLWANELTEGQGRAVVLGRAALAMLGTDPSGAFALSEHLAAGDRAQFFESVFAGWGTKDTDAALGYAEQLPDPAERDNALKSIRSVAPVGIGAELRLQDGLAVINRLLPGTPAELGGQLRAGDRILAVAQGTSPFVDARDMPLANLVQMIRGEPGSVLQLQVLPADAPPDSSPRTVAVVRGQIKFKQ